MARHALIDMYSVIVTDKCNEITLSLPCFLSVGSDVKYMTNCGTVQRQCLSFWCELGKGFDQFVIAYFCLFSCKEV